jgi:lysophospholipase L1-like esterase
VKKRKKIVWIIGTIAALLLVENLFIGYRFSWGLFKGLGDIRMGKLPGNAPEYSMNGVERLAGNPLDGKNVLFLGSSVTYGAASVREGIPEYFAARLGCEVTKEAVSGTTLVDNGDSSYVQRLLKNVDPATPYSLVVCQLSTNDATKKLPLGQIGQGTDKDSFDTATVTGAMEFIIAYAKETWDCPVVFYTNARYDSAEYAAMVQRLRELQDKWGIGVLDLWSDDEFNAISDADRALYMNDNIHPTKAGYRDWWCPVMEQQLLDYLNSIG